MKQIMRATQSFRASAGGLSVGDLVPDTHPLVKAYPAYFEPATDFVARQFPELVGDSRQSQPVEAATAEPGEKRTVKPRSTGRAKKPDGE